MLSTDSCDKLMLNELLSRNYDRRKNHSFEDYGQIDNISSRQSSIFELVCHLLRHPNEARLQVYRP